VLAITRFRLLSRTRVRRSLGSLRTEPADPGLRLDDPHSAENPMSEVGVDLLVKASKLNCVFLSREHWTVLHRAHTDIVTGTAGTDNLPLVLTDLENPRLMLGHNDTVGAVL
jgi:hypothetical protein